jgi:hypothetical protein
VGGRSCSCASFGPAAAKGVQHEYVRRVESYREHGRNKRRVVQHLGRKDVLEAHLEDLIRLLRDEAASTAAPFPTPERCGKSSGWTRFFAGAADAAARTAPRGVIEPWCG